MNETLRGVVIFAAVLVTLWLWAPLNSHAARTTTGTVVTDTYFGPLRYLVLRTELKEPDYSFQRQVQPQRLVITALLTIGLWSAVIWKVRRRPADSGDQAKIG